MHVCLVHELALFCWRCCDCNACYKVSSAAEAAATVSAKQLRSTGMGLMEQLVSSLLVKSLHGAIHRHLGYLCYIVPSAAEAAATVSAKQLRSAWM